MTAAKAAETVHVALGERSYDILIGPGLLDDAGLHVAAVLPGARAAIVTDGNVARHHLENVASSLTVNGIDSSVISLPAGEPTKRFEVLQEVVYKILDAKLERGDVVIALGGGVIGDLAGFAAAIVRRGMNFVLDADQPACPGRFVGRRQDRHQRPARQEPDRRLLPAAPRAGRHGGARHLAETRIPRPVMPRSSNTG